MVNPAHSICLPARMHSQEMIGDQHLARGLALRVLLRVELEAGAAVARPMRLPRAGVAV